VERLRCIIVCSTFEHMMPSTEVLDFEILRELTLKPVASQRSLAARLGVSVGRINYCLRALADKGWVKADNFRRSDNKRAYLYLLTPTGMEAKARLTREFLSQKTKEYERLRQQIATLRREVKQ
jgi:EPS-associated MarR family transcriptional regulator